MSGRTRGFIALAAVACLALPFGSAIAEDRAEEAQVSDGAVVESIEESAEAPPTCELSPGARYVSRDPAKCADQTRIKTSVRGKKGRERVEQWLRGEPTR